MAQKAVRDFPFLGVTQSRHPALYARDPWVSFHVET